ncbi:DUF397 domain-containing protein [Streptomyces mayteni]
MSSDLVWVKSSYSTSSGGECVEVSPSLRADRLVPVRDSKVAVGPALVFSVDGWVSFVAAVAGGVRGVDGDAG